MRSDRGVSLEVLGGKVGEMKQLRIGEFVHWVEVTDVFHARASYDKSAALEGLTGSQIVVIEVCRTYPEKARIVKLIHAADDLESANLIGEGAAITYGAKFIGLKAHDAATCQHEDCRTARMTDRERRDLETFGMDADRIDASPGRYW